jgi:SAM-dependent methyltransferase
MVDPKRLVADGYDQLYQTYATWSPSAHNNLRRRYIDQVVEFGVPSDGTALDLGCGTGRHATAYLVECGLDVTGVDISPKSIEAARKAIPSARFLVGDMSSIDLPKSSFDLVVAFYSIIHVPRPEHTSVLANIYSWLRPGGRMALSMNGGDLPGGGVDDSWLGKAPMYWSNWDVATNRRLISEAGFEIELADIEIQEEEGQEVSFLWVIAHKRNTWLRN